MTESSVRILVLMTGALAMFGLELARNHTPRLRTAALFAGLWFGLSSLLANIIAVRSDWWEFSIQDAMLYGVPVDLMIGLGFFSAVAAALAGISLKKAALSLALDIIAMGVIYAPQSGMAVLHDGASWGLALIFGGAVVAAFLAHCTAADRFVYARTGLQAVIWTALLLWLLPSVALAKTGSDWGVVLHGNLFILIPMLLPAGMIVNALYVFAKYGDGTGFPYDPPKRLVTQGIYQYVSNPMQIAICVAMGWWGVVLQNAVVMACAPMAVCLFVAFKDVCNGSSNLCGDDPEWLEYQRRVPRWLPKIK